MMGKEVHQNSEIPYQNHTATPVHHIGYEVVTERVQAQNQAKLLLALTYWQDSMNHTSKDAVALGNHK